MELDSQNQPYTMRFMTTELSRVLLKRIKMARRYLKLKDAGLISEEDYYPIKSMRDAVNIPAEELAGIRKRDQAKEEQ